MKKINLSVEEAELMNYNDIAYLILDNNGKKMKITNLFSDISEILNLDENEYQSYIGDFFELLSTDKRFIMLEDGYWDLKIKHNKGMETFEDEDDEDEEIILEEEDIPTDDDLYDGQSSKADDDDVDDDDLSDLVIVDDLEDDSNM